MSRQQSSIDASSSCYCYDLAIIRRGMIGSAAARHAAKILADSNDCCNGTATPSIVLIGPSEPNNNDDDDDDKNSTRCVFGAHYDEGRITRRTDIDPIWAELASRSIARYNDIAQESSSSSSSSSIGGTKEFYVECGHLAVGLKGSDTIDQRQTAASNMGIDVATLNSTALRDQFPYLTFPEDCVGIHETKDAGYISARGLVAAQTAAARNLGVDIIDNVVTRVQRVVVEDYSNREGEYYYFLIVTVAGGGEQRIIKSKRVLVAAGAFCNDQPLLPKKLAITPIKTQTVHFILSQEDEEKLKNMPSVIVKTCDFWAYILPPILYPDKDLTTRLKIGGAYLDCSTGKEVLGHNREMKCGKEVVDWYQSTGSIDSQIDMVQLLQSLLPSIKSVQQCPKEGGGDDAAATCIKSKGNYEAPKATIISNTCATPNTPTRQAYIGEVKEGWAVATGGNGSAAKSSDEIGRLAALCILDRNAFGKESICGELCKDVFCPMYESVAV